MIPLFHKELRAEPGFAHDSIMNFLTLGFSVCRVPDDPVEDERICENNALVIEPDP